MWCASTVLWSSKNKTSPRDVILMGLRFTTRSTRGLWRSNNFGRLVGGNVTARLTNDFWKKVRGMACLVPVNLVDQRRCGALCYCPVDIAVHFHLALWLHGSYFKAFTIFRNTCMELDHPGLGHNVPWATFLFSFFSVLLYRWLLFGRQIWGPSFPLFCLYFLSNKNLHRF